MSEISLLPFTLTLQSATFSCLYAITLFRTHTPHLISADPSISIHHTPLTTGRFTNTTILGLHSYYTYTSHTTPLPTYATRERPTHIRSRRVHTDPCTQIDPLPTITKHDLDTCYHAFLKGTPHRLYKGRSSNSISVNSRIRVQKASVTFCQINPSVNSKNRK